MSDDEDRRYDLLVLLVWTGTAVFGFAVLFAFYVMLHHLAEWAGLIS